MVGVDLTFQPLNNESLVKEKIILYSQLLEIKVKVFFFFKISRILSHF